MNKLFNVFLITAAIFGHAEIVAMDNEPSNINLVTGFVQAAVRMNSDFDTRTLDNAESTTEVPGFQKTFTEYSDRILHSVNPELAQYYHAYPDNECLAIVKRYAQAVTLRLTLIPDAQKPHHITWAQYWTPKDLREFDYICEGRPSTAFCSKGIMSACKKDLALKFKEIVKEFSQKQKIS